MKIWLLLLTRFFLSCVQKIFHKQTIITVFLLRSIFSLQFVWIVFTSGKFLCQIWLQVKRSQWVWRYTTTTTRTTMMMTCKGSSRSSSFEGCSEQRRRRSGIIAELNRLNRVSIRFCDFLRWIYMQWLS